MKVKGFKISFSIKALLFGSLGTLFISGIAWIIIHNYYSFDSEFGAIPSPLEPTLLKLHGAAAPFFLLVLGALFPTHISRAYNAKINLKTGLSLLIITTILIASGYLLYYLGDEQIRNLSSYTHSILGIISIPLLVVHIISGKTLTNYRKNKLGRSTK